MTSIAVTGATGFVGQAVIDLAVAAGADIRALTRRPQPERAGVTWIAGDLDNVTALDSLCSGARAVLHIAGAVNVPTRAAFAAANIDGTQAVIDAAARAGVRRFVHVSSLAAREPQLSNYGWSKAGAETAVKASHCDWTIVRPPGVYGPRDRDMLDLFVMAGRGIMILPPTGRGSWIYVDDLARLLLTLTSVPGHRDLFEISDGTPAGMTHDDFAAAIGLAMGRNRVLRFAAPRWLLALAARGDRLVRGDRAKLTPDRAAYMAHPDWVADPGLAPPPALWTPKIAPAAGLAATARWYRDNGLV